MNSSILGPIIVEDIGFNETLVTFTKPYIEIPLVQKVVHKFSKPDEKLVNCRSVRLVGPSTSIYITDRFDDMHGNKSVTYLFKEKSVDCFVKCRKEHLWSVKYQNGKVRLEYESE